jgi:hypothetical protein
MVCMLICDRLIGLRPVPVFLWSPEDTPSATRAECHLTVSAHSPQFRVLCQSFWDGPPAGKGRAGPPREPGNDEPHVKLLVCEKYLMRKGAENGV